MASVEEQQQLRRLADSAAFVAAWNGAMTFMPQASRIEVAAATTTPSVSVSEGAVRPVEVALLVDPLGLARLTHDDADDDMAAVVARQSRVIAAKLEAHNLADARRDCRERVRVPGALDGGANAPMRLSIVNMVHTNYLTTRGRELDSDDESEPGKRTRTRGTRTVVQKLMNNWNAAARPSLFNESGSNDDNDDDAELSSAESDADVSATALGGGRAEEDEVPTRGRPLTSLRWLQRRLLRVGYNKNEVGTALGIRFAGPWTSSHHVFPTGRVQTTGANNRRVDRVLLKHATVQYLRATGACALRVTRRVSQNIVAKYHLPAPDGFSVGIFAQQHPDNGKPTKCFKGGICVRMPKVGTMLVFRKGSVICVGTSSVQRLQRAFARFEPEFRGCINTPATVARERHLVAVGMLPKFLAYPDAERAQDRTAREQRAVIRASRRDMVRAGQQPVFRRRILGVPCYC